MNSQLQATHKRLRGHIYVQSTYKLLAAVFEDITERIYGRTFAFKTLPRYQEINAARSQPWLLPTPPSPPPAAPHLLRPPWPTPGPRELRQT